MPFLEELHKHTDVALVVSQPQRPRDRGQEVSPSPVALRAAELGLKVITPEKLPEAAETIKAVNADYGAAVAYGKIFRQNILGSTRLGILNIHFSLLPAFRGAAPVQRSLMAGAAKTGVSAFWINEGLDAGNIIGKKETPVSTTDDAKSLFSRLIPMGTELLKETALAIADGNIKATPQKEDGASYAPKLEGGERFINFAHLSAEQVHNKVRALTCNGYAKAIAEDNSCYISITKTSLPAKEPARTGRGGTVLSIDKEKGFLVECREGSIYVERLVYPGKKEMSAYDFANGHKIKEKEHIFK